MFGRSNQMTFGVNAIIQLADLVTGGNYGFLCVVLLTLGDHGLVLSVDRDSSHDRGHDFYQYDHSSTVRKEEYLNLFK